MRLLHVVPTYLPATRYGGPIYSVHGLCKGLAATGQDVQVFTTNVDGPGESPVPLDRPMDVDGVQVRYFPSQALRKLYWSPAMGRALGREISGFDLVHLHSVFLWPTWAAARAARAAGVPYVLSPRGMLVKELIERKSRWLKTAWISLIERRNIEAAAVIHATSEVEALELAKFGFSLSDVAIVPNGVGEPRAFSKTDLGQDVKTLVEKQPLVLYLGRISWKKGLDLLIAAASHLHHGHLAIVGNDEEGLLPRLAVQAEGLQVSSRVTFIPRAVHGADKEALFAAASLFVLPSISENFGNVVLEAMARARPVVVSRSVGAAEIVENAGAGLIFDGTPEGLAAKISTLLGDPVRARARGEAGAREVHASFTWPMIAARMAEVYERAIGRSARL